MKKLFVILGVGILTISSCKKDWNCECTVNESVVSNNPIKDKSKKEAISECNREVTLYEDSVSVSVSCAIK